MKLYIARDITPGEYYNRPISVNFAAPPFKDQGVTAIMLGSKGAGKSNANAVVLEECHNNRLPFIVYDPTGEQVGLADLGDDVAIIGDKRNTKPEARAMFSLGEVLNDTDKFIKLSIVDGFSFVVDLSVIEDDDERALAFARIMDRHYVLGNLYKKPVFIVVDEVHLFAPQVGISKEKRVSLNVLKKVARDGRKRGMPILFSTQQTVSTSKDIISLTNAKFIGMLDWFGHFKHLKEEMHGEITYKEVNQLNTGQFFFVRRRFSRRKVMINLRKTKTYGGTPVIAPRAGKRPSFDDGGQHSFFVKDEYVLTNINGEKNE